MKPASGDPTAETKDAVLWFLGVATLVALLVLAIFAWMDSRKVPEIVFSAPPSIVAIVDVRGAVATPGVVTVQPGDRMIDVVREAGGLKSDADTSLVNMSTRVNDGQLIVIPTISALGESHHDGKIDINTASVTELDQLPGIGAVRAEQIVAYRQANGPFQSIDDLVAVEGISPTLLETLRPLIRVSGDD